MRINVYATHILLHEYVWTPQSKCSKYCPPHTLIPSQSLPSFQWGMHIWIFCPFSKRPFAIMTKIYKFNRNWVICIGMKIMWPHLVYLLHETCIYIYNKLFDLIWKFTIFDFFFFFLILFICVRSSHSQVCVYQTQSCIWNCKKSVCSASIVCVLLFCCFRVFSFSFNQLKFSWNLIEFLIEKNSNGDFSLASTFFGQHGPNDTANGCKVNRYFKIWPICVQRKRFQAGTVAVVTLQIRFWLKNHFNFKLLTDS